MSEVMAENSIYVELEGTKPVKSLNLGDKVELIVRGRVKGIEQRIDGDGSPYSCLYLVDYVSKLAPNRKSAMADLVDEEDD